MIVLGADTHKRSHTIAAIVAGTGELLGERTVPVGRRGFRALLQWARSVDDARVWALEDCRHVSGSLERFLIARRASVADPDAPDFAGKHVERQHFASWVLARRDPPAGVVPVPRPTAARARRLAARRPGRQRDQDRRETGALCRCCKSRMRPFCDGTHNLVRFRCPGSLEHRREAG
jgi:CDGSH-type Zn-finger protein